MINIILAIATWAILIIAALAILRSSSTKGSELEAKSETSARTRYDQAHKYPKK